MSHKGITTIDAEFEKAGKKGMKWHQRKAQDSMGLHPKRAWSTTEKQGSGRAYWFKEAKDAEAFAAEKKAKGHQVVHHPGDPTDEDNAEHYVWHSNTTKKHSSQTREVMAGIDPLAHSLQVQEGFIQKAGKKGMK